MIIINEEQYLNDLTLESTANSVTERRTTKDGLHRLNACNVHISPKTNSTSIKFDLVNNLNSEMGVDDYLRFSSYGNFESSMNKLRYLFQNLISKEFLIENEKNGKLPNLAIPKRIDFTNTATGEIHQNVIQTFTIDLKGMWVQATAINPENVGEAYKELISKKMKEIRASLGDERFDLIEASAYTKTEEVLKADGTKKTVATEKTYTAIRIDETKVQQFANNLVGLMQEHLNKFIILKTFVAKNGVTKVSSYEKNHLLS